MFSVRYGFACCFLNSMNLSFEINSQYSVRPRSNVPLYLSANMHKIDIRLCGRKQGTFRQEAAKKHF